MEFSHRTYGEHGTLIVCGDYEGDLEAIAEVLNGFEFDQDDGQDQRFVVDDKRIEPDRFDIEAVFAAFPLRAWFKSEDGRRLPANKVRELPDEDDWDFDEYDNISLEELSKTFAPLLNRGTLELVSIRHYRSREIWFEKLAIRSDGWVQRESQRYENFQRDKWHKCSTATFKPPKLSDPVVVPPHRSKRRSSKKAVPALPAIAGREGDNEPSGTGG